MLITQRIAIRIPRELEEAMERLIEAQVYKSRSEIVREAVKELLKKEFWGLNEGWTRWEKRLFRG
ncbi:MAG: transcriptional regulator [Thermoprotei archaeon]|nr:MAG: transcriptional regulator [Thermoprotei archaeon]RLF02380.1 MAG: transcriptional regulator [Thermoprotei archaeon]